MRRVRRSVQPPSERPLREVAPWIGSVALGFLALVYAIPSGPSPRLSRAALPDDWTWPLLAVSAFAVGAASSAVQRRLARSAGDANWLGTASLALPLIALLSESGALGGTAVSAALAIYVLGVSVDRVRRHGRAAVLLIVALGAAVLAFVERADGWTLATFAFQCAVVAWGLANDHARAVREKLLARRAWVPFRARDLEAPRGRGARSSLAGAALALGALIVAGAAGRTLREIGRDAEREADVEGPDGARRPDRRSSRKLGRDWSSQLGFGSSTGERSEDVRAYVSAFQDGGLAGGAPLYLTLLRVDTVTEQGIAGLDAARLPLLEDRDDGVEDGWTELGVSPGAPRLELEIEQQRFELERAGCALLRVEPALAILLPRVRYDASSALVDDGPGVGNVSFRLLAAPSPEPPRAEASVRARHRDPRYVQLPAPSRELETLAAYARERARGATTDAERVLAIVDHFRREFDYSLEPTRARGLAGLVEFVARREGFCASFASASVLMLRSIGLPARAVTGFLASEFDDETLRYVVRGRHGHTWIEVHFEELGWVRFDPTPSSGRPGPGAGGARRDELYAWGEALVEGAAGMALSKPDAPTVGELLHTAARAPRAWFEGVRAGGTFALAATALVLGALVALVARKLRKAFGGRATREERALIRYEDRLIRALARRGHEWRPSRTLRELADAALARDGEVAGDVGRVVDLLYRARFAAIALESGERAAIEVALADFERPADEPRPAPRGPRNVATATR